MFEIKGKFTTATVMIDEVEPSCVNQIYQMVNNAAFDQPIVIMPDTHAGKGSVIGFTMPLTDKIIPNVVGVDIGCGMLSLNMGSKFPLNKDKLLKIDGDMRKVVPVGTNLHSKSSIPSKYFEKNFPWYEANEALITFIGKYNDKFNTDFKSITFDYNWFLQKTKQIKMRQDAELGIGTLGGGNHFIEVGISDKTGMAWLTIHSGSRNFGKMICDHHQAIARKHIEQKRKVLLRAKVEYIQKNFSGNEIPRKIVEAKKELGLDSEINTRNMEYLDGQLAIDYFTDMIFTQKYAIFNRRRMADLILDKLKLEQYDYIESIHNFIDFQDMTIRKGAISSYEYQRMIIPFNMAEGLLICEGKNNSDWNFSAPHGAGRVMSRGHASRNIDIKDFKYKMKGIVSTSVNKDTLDEAPQAYKNSKMIEEAIGPIATILERVKPILNLKAAGKTMSWKEKKERIKRDKERKRERHSKMKNYNK